MRVPLRYRLLLWIALLLAAASVLWFGWLELKVSRPGRANPANRTEINLATYASAPLEPPPAVMAEWAPPVAQGRGPEWIYDVFDPPDLDFDATRNVFVVRPRGSGVEAAAEPAPVELELLAVTHALFRLQLRGFVGAEGHRLGSFEDTVTGETILAKAGCELPTVNAVIEDFTVRRAPPAGGREGPAGTWFATATLRENGTGRTRTLKTWEPSYGEELIATVAVSTDGTPESRDYREGDEVEGIDGSYRIDRLDLEPPRAHIAAVGAAGTGWRWELAPKRETADRAGKERR